MIALNNNWEFTTEWNEDFLRWRDGSNEKVRIPHTVKELPLHYINERDYQMISGYRRKISIPKKADGKRIFLQFDGAAHIATVYVNGIELMTHKGGYTAFRVEITNHVIAGEKCEVAVKLDSTENPTVPPFGFVIDYLTYGGIYRPVWLDIEEKDFISDIFVSTPSLDTVHVITTIDGDENLEKTIRVKELDGTVVGEKITDKNDITLRVPDPKLWNCDNPNLYICEVSLANGSVKTARFGFRLAEFRADGFYLNGLRMVMRGLDRHQNYPYVGYAVSDSLQVEDARILKEELCCNAVRTSHYPQSQAFIDACDEKGLLVFTEIPGWQHIGDLEWKKVACQHVREMILQYRNHPSIVLWGVRINESQDDDEFYTATNKIAHELDPTRPTSGVRYIEKSHLLEDVYAFNDFSHTGNNPGARKKKDITPDVKKSFLISEANGHMFPTKSFDKWSLRQEHALRHARVMNAALGSGEHAGVFQWCMFDYATHKDFGSGDRVCYHGVMDMFRNPKLASAVYAMQGDKDSVLEVGTSMDIGDYPGGNVGSFYVFTNADSVKLYKNDVFVKEFKESEFKALKHGPLLIDDTIGKLLETNEGFTGDKEKLLHDCLLSAAKNGINDMPLKDKAKMGYAMMKYKLKYEDGVVLFGKYVGNWGGEATVWRFDGIKNGEVAVSRTLCPSSRLHLEVRQSTTELHEGDMYDMAAVRVRVLDEYDNIAPYAQLPVRFAAEGDIEVVGPDCATAEGGMTGTYIRTVGRSGAGKLTVSASGLEDVVIEFTVKE
ncbi:MAG: glycoside hydrolase family 2 protein [Erysipelotrichaceae bacterium]|nr:glycoside hydrolase family 2 protein [Erysipelotrichaceae bacterium]